MRLDSPGIKQEEKASSASTGKRSAKQRTVPLPPTLRQAVKEMCQSYSRCIAFNFWDSEYFVSRTGDPSVVLHFRHPGVLRNLLLFRDRIFLTECWLHRQFEFEGAIAELINFAEHLAQYRPGAHMMAAIAVAAASLPRLTLPKSGVANLPVADFGRGSTAREIQHHYDVGNDFYQLLLDPLMIYSCAYFREPDMTLAQAQREKLNLICRKLRLKPGEKLLDVGCGWGGLLRFAAKHYGVTAYGITLSKEQLAHGLQAAAAEGLSDRVRMELRDYRQMPAGVRFDKIVSVGMIEHVGVRNYPVYFGRLLDALEPGGLFLCHGITTFGASNRPTFNGKFVRKYIFPGGELANLPEVLHYASVAGWEPIDVDGWRSHYVKTLQAWAANLEANWHKAVSLAGERIAKLWLLYLTASAIGFENNWLRIYQVMLRRHEDRVWDLPPTRMDWLV